MGWFGGLFGGGADDSSGDPLAKLDPKLRAFLEKESPVKYKTQQQQPPPQEDSSAPPTTTSRTTTANPTAAATEDAAAAAAASPSVPRESLFQDGRYAHLWRTYRSYAETEAEGKTDHDKLMDVLEAYKDRKAQIGRAALENCALEQADWNACMKGGDWGDRMTMCNAQVRKFERCYTMQSRLLKALGYLSTYDRSPEKDEQIQLHADKLFHQMLAQEAEMDKAKAEGRPVPTFAPLIPKPARTAAGGDEEDAAADVSRMSAEKRKKWMERLEKVPEAERYAEEEAMKAEMRAKAEVASRVTSLWEEKKMRDGGGADATAAAAGGKSLPERVAGFFGVKPQSSSSTPSSSSSSTPNSSENR